MKNFVKWYVRIIIMITGLGLFTASVSMFSVALVPAMQWWFDATDKALIYSSNINIMVGIAPLCAFLIMVSLMVFGCFYGVRMVSHPDCFLDSEPSITPYEG